MNIVVVVASKGNSGLLTVMELTTTCTRTNSATI